MQLCLLDKSSRFFTHKPGGEPRFDLAIAYRFELIIITIMQQYNLDSLSALSPIREQKFLLISAHNRELKRPRWRRLQKTIDLIIKTTALHMHHTF